MKKIIILLLTLFNLILANNIDIKLSTNNNLNTNVDQSFNQLLNKIQTNDFKYFQYLELYNKEYNKELKNLKLKIITNQKLNNKVAVARDYLEIEILNNKISLNKIFEKLKYKYDNYKSKKNIDIYIKSSKLKILNEKYKLYKNLYIINNKIKDINKNQVVKNFIKNYKQDYIEYKYSILLLNKINQNTIKFSQINSFDYFNKINLNQNVYINKINNLLNKYLNTSFKNIIYGLISIIFLMLIYYIFKHFFAKKILQRIYKIKDINDEELIELYINFNKKISFLGFIFSLNILVYIFSNYSYNTFFSIIYILSIIYISYTILNYIILHNLEKFFLKYPNVRKEMISFVLKIFKLLLFTITLVIILSKLNFDIKALLASLGVGGIAIALASKDTLSNLFGSITIMLDNSYEQGDWIKTSTYEGTVIEIRMRTTTIRTFDNAYVTIPNSILANSSIKNYSKRKIGRRIKLKLNVTYESKMENILKSIEEIKEYLLNNKNIATEKTFIDIKSKSSRLLKKEDAIGVKRTLLVFIDNYNSSSIDILVYCFARTINWEEWLKIKQEVLIEINAIFKRNNIDFAYNTITNNVKIIKDEN